MNTKKSTLLLLCAFGLTFCASAGAATYFATAATEMSQTTLTMVEGASIRSFAPTGIRFVSTISSTEYETLSTKNAEFYTLILPEKLVPAGGITADNYLGLGAEIVKANQSIVDHGTTVTFSGTLAGRSNGDGTYQDLPEMAYNMPFTAVSYYTYEENGTKVVEFASNPQTYTIAYIASALQAEGHNDQYYAKITDHVLSDGISFGDRSYTVHAGATTATTLNSQDLKAVYTSDKENVVKVDKDGQLTGVGKGTATVTAKIGNKTTTAEVTVNSIFANNPTFADDTRMFAESVDEKGNVSAIPAKSAYSEREATFNVEASTQYYAEATFTYNVTEDWPMIGLAHFNALNETIAEGDTYNNAGNLIGRRCIESVVTNSGKFIIKDLKPTDAHWFENFKTDNIYLNESFKDNSTFTTMTIAIARSADKMYTFVDGVLISEYAVPTDYIGNNTTPGIITCGNAGSFTVSGINVLSGNEAHTKLVDLTEIAQSTFRNNPTLSDGSKLYTENKDANGNIIVSSNKRGEFAATFNMDASTLYYAEATFNITNTKHYTAFGLAHFTALNTSVNEAADTFDAGSSLGRACVASIKSGTSATFLIGNLTASIERWHVVANTAAELYKKGDFQDNNFTQMKIAIARTADKMYTFVNGVLVQEITAPEGYNNVATTPGIITIGDENKFTASNIQLLSGAEAQNKIEALGMFRNNPTLSDCSNLYTVNKDANGITVSSNKNGEFAATFNMEASTLYYAEATFYVIDISNQYDYPAFGLAHYLALNTSVNEAHTEIYDAGSRLGRACVASIKSGTSATFFIGNLTASHERWYNAANTTAELYKKGDFKANTFTQMTIAIARTADTLYTFVNGELVQAVAAPEGYKDVATTPGIITICNANRFTASNIQLLSGTEAQNKINELTAPKA